MNEDQRPAFVLNDVSGAGFFQVNAKRSKDASTVVLQNVSDFRAYQCRGVMDTRLERVEQKKL